MRGMHVDVEVVCCFLRLRGSEQVMSREFFRVQRKGLVGQTWWQRRSKDRETEA
jgi:hypothetical protein